ncbi:MAG: zinc-binding dehydrogenase [Candidatus Methanofastidiosia archaeon]
MKAVVFHEHGGVEKLSYEEVEDPIVESREVLIKVKACALNHLDLHVRKGIPGLKLKLPHILGSDISGVVEKVGEEVFGVEEGQNVVINPGLSCGKCEFCLQGEDSLCIKYRIIGEHVPGGYAEFLKVPGKNVILFPDEFSFEDVASVPLVFMTAWRMLVSRGKLKPGEDILILGASGGVGTASVQIAKLCGLRVFATTSSEEKTKKLSKLGTDHIIDYTRVDFAKEIKNLTKKRGVDIVVDCVGATTWRQSLQSLAKNGRLLTCGATTGPNPETDLRYIFWNQLHIIGSTMGTKKELLDVLKLVWQRKLKPVVDRVLPLKDARKAHELMEARSQFGKLVLRV